MFRNERYFDKNENKSNYFGQFEDAIPQEEEETTEVVVREDDEKKQRSD